MGPFSSQRSVGRFYRESVVSARELAMLRKGLTLISLAIGLSAAGASNAGNYSALLQIDGWTVQISGDGLP